MFQINDTVIYGSHGVCTISEIARQTIDGKDVNYYVLTPAFEGKFTIFVPVDNDALTGKMRKILSADEIHALLKAMPDEELIWIDDDNARKEHFRIILQDGDRQELIRLIKTLYVQQQRRKESGKRLLVADERTFQDAERLLYEEFAYVLNLERDQVLPYIISQIEAQ